MKREDRPSLEQMLKFQGIGISAAVAIGRIRILGPKGSSAEKIFIDDYAAEITRLMSAIERTKEQMNQIYQKALEEVGGEQASLFSAYRLILEDEYYLTEIKGIIKAESVCAEYAVDKATMTFMNIFASMEDDYMKERADDFKDISNHLLANLDGSRRSDDRLAPSATDKCQEADDRYIICADNLTPTDTIVLDKSKVLAFATSKGSPNSHAAILAANMGIPAVLSLGDEWFKTIAEGDEAIVDGHTGTFIQNPDETITDSYRKKQQEDCKMQELLKSLRGKENITLDGTKIEICANIGSPEQTADALDNDADGIGLFRSEILYLEGSDYPSEERQFEAYKKALQGMDGRRVIIRTLDIGADKQVAYFNLGKEENPALGFRAIRICLKRPEIFKTQLRALYRASAYGRLGIMFPMITSVEEVEKVIEICNEVKSGLDSEHIEYSKRVELGIMIETPAAAIISDRLAPLIDFFSIGTNDLLQYTLACDRTNSDAWQFCNPKHEALLRLIKISADNAHAAGRWIGICGELAADLTLTEAFLRMGIDELSVSPGSILKLRERVRSIRLPKSGAGTHG